MFYAIIKSNSIRMGKKKPLNVKSEMKQAQQYQVGKLTENFEKVKEENKNLKIHVLLFATPWDYITCQAPLSMGFSRQGYWSGLPFPSPGDLPNRGMKLRSPKLQADSLPSVPPQKPKIISSEFKIYSYCTLYLKDQKNYKEILNCFKLSCWHKTEAMSILSAQNGP